MKFIAHRGYSLVFPENTLPAFKAVLDHPLCGTLVTGIELDIHLTADEKITVMHDTSVIDASGKKRTVADCTFAELSAFSKTAHGDTFPGVPDLESVLALVEHAIELNIEVKAGNYDLPTFATLLSRTLAGYHPDYDIVISSFSYDLIEYLRRHLGNLKLKYAYIFQSSDALLSVPKGVRSRFDLLHPFYQLVLAAPELFTSTTPIRCWTVNDLPTAQMLIARQRDLPVEALLTDDLSLPAACLPPSTLSTIN